MFGSILKRRSNMSNKNIELQQAKRDFAEYDLQKYLSDVDQFGLQNLWDSILEWALHNKVSDGIFRVSNFGELYEIGLARENKLQKNVLEDF